MKFKVCLAGAVQTGVILRARMWIEMVDVQRFHNIFIVILLVRMWIEVLTFLCHVIVSFCHSSREEMD